MEMLSNLAVVTPVNQWPGNNRECGSLALKRGRQIFLKRADLFIFGEKSSINWNESRDRALLTKVGRTL